MTQLKNCFLFCCGVSLLLASVSCGRSQKNDFAEVVDTDTLAMIDPGNYLLDIRVDSMVIEDFKIRQGENLGAILGRFDVSQARIASSRRVAAPAFDLTKMRAGNNYSRLTNLENGFAE